jgi:hypothetical protein
VQCLNLERELDHPLSKLCIFRFKPLKQSLIARSSLITLRCFRFPYRLTYHPLLSDHPQPSVEWYRYVRQGGVNLTRRAKRTAASELLGLVVAPPPPVISRDRRVTGQATEIPAPPSGPSGFPP